MADFDMRQIFGAMVANQGDGGEDEPGLTDYQIVNRLREHYELLGEKHTFTPGQIIIHKFPESATTKNAKQPAVFMRYLDEPISGPELVTGIEDVSGHLSTITMDCIVGCWSSGSFVTFMMSSDFFKPHPTFGTSSQPHGDEADGD